MSNGDKDAMTGHADGSGRGSAVRLTAILASVPFASVVVAVITVACIAGTLIPQGGDVAKLLQKNPGAKGWMDLLGFLGLTHVFSSWWFITLLCLLSASLIICSGRRLTAARRRTGRARSRALGSLITHISLLLILAGGVVRGTFGEQGYIEFRQGETRDRFRVAGGTIQLPFSIHLEKFEIETYDPSENGDSGGAITAERLLVVRPDTGHQWSIPVKLNDVGVLTGEGEAPGPENSFYIKVLRRVADFVINMETREIESRSDEPNNPAILVEVVHNGYTNNQWLFALHPDFKMHGAELPGAKLDLRYQVSARPSRQRSIKDYKSTLRIIEDGEVVREKTIEVNSPLSYGGYTFYQSGFDPKDPKWTSLQVVRDPGVPLVYAGFGLMMVGLTAVLYLYPEKRTTGGAGGDSE